MFFVYFQPKVQKTALTAEDVVQKLFSVAKKGSGEPKTTLKTDDLEMNKIYKVTRIRTIETMYGVKVVIDMDQKFSYFLPERFASVFASNLFKSVNIVPDNLGFVYRGRGENNTVLCDLVELQEEEVEQNPAEEKKNN